jgi:hypothetical protein
VDLSSLAHDRRLQIGAVVAGAGVAGVVLLRKRLSGGGAAPASSTDTAAPPYAPGGFPDTSGTDLASWLGNYTSNIDQELQTFAAGQQDILTALGNLGGSEGKPPGGVATPPKPKPIPPPAVLHPPAKPPIHPGTVTVTRFTTHDPAWTSTLSGIAGHEHMTVGQLLKLNPSIKNPDLVRTGQQIRIR